MQQVKQPCIVDEYPENQDDLSSEEYQEYEEDEIETLYILVSDEDPLKPLWNGHQITAAIMGFLALAMIIGLCCIPTSPSYILATVSVPAQFHTLQFKADSVIIPTGKHEYPATRAKGTITFFNGGFLSKQIPANFILTTQDGIEVATDYAVTIPANNPPSNGEASVSAHALIAGSSGNIQAGAINQVYEGDIYVKNLAAFSGGQDAHTTTYATSQDKQNALDTARRSLASQKYIGLQPQPCKETTSQKALNLTVTLTCQYADYRLPPNVQANQVLSVQLVGKSVILKVRVVAKIVTSHFVK